MTSLVYHLPPPGGGARKQEGGVVGGGGGVLWIKEGRMRATDNEADLS